MKQLFPIEASGSTITREVLAGITTFVTMSYILVVQPAVLSVDFAGAPTGLDAGAVLLATCVASALATALMGVYGRLPIALAPGMGQNYFFVSVIMALSAQGGSSPPWQTALAIVFIAGVLFLLLTLVGLRDLVLDVMSPSMRSAMAVGIGVFIAFIGLQNAGVVADAPSLVSLNAAALTSPDAMVFWVGLLATMILTCLRTPGGILMGIVVASVLAWQLGKLSLIQVVGWPEFHSSPVFQFDFGGALTAMGLTYIAAFLFMDVFDTTGTLVAVSQQAGLVKDSKIPRSRQAMLADAAGTIAGACMGTSTITSYIESAAGVQQGGRTGLTAIVVAVLFLLAIPFSPIIIALGGYPPITAPALVFVGSMMFRSVQCIEWNDETEAIPCFFVILGIPLFYSIADGIALGLIVWPLLKLVRGRFNEVKWQSIVLASLLLAYYATVRTSV